LKLLPRHTPRSRRQYYGAKPLEQLRGLVDLETHEGDTPLDPAGLIAAARALGDVRRAKPPRSRRATRA
jgi:hypothetical protein